MMTLRRNRSRGFTLLELLVVGILGALVLTIIANAWRWYARSIGDIQVTAILTRELKIATEAIAQDYGPSIATRTPDASTLQLDIDGGPLNGAADWDTPDTVVEYSIEDEQLIRRDLKTGTEIPLARHIISMDTEVVDGQLQLHLLARLRKTDLSMTLQLQGS